jgi:hypothetical protein
MFANGILKPRVQVLTMRRIKCALSNSTTFYCCAKKCNGLEFIHETYSLLLLLERQAAGSLEFTIS